MVNLDGPRPSACRRRSVSESLRLNDRRARQAQTRQSQTVGAGARPPCIPPAPAGSGAGASRRGRRAQGARLDPPGAGPGRQLGGAAAAVLLRFHAARPATRGEGHGQGSGHHARPRRRLSGVHVPAGAVGGRVGPVRPVPGWRGRAGGLRGPPGRRYVPASRGAGAGGPAGRPAVMGGSRRVRRDPPAASGCRDGQVRTPRDGCRRLGAGREPVAGGAAALAVRGLAPVLPGHGLFRRGRRRWAAPNPRSPAGRFRPSPARGP